MARVIEHITGWLKQYTADSGIGGFVVGVSGGIDSALTSTLGARTGCPTLCLEMPIHQAENQVNRARRHVEWLKHNNPNVRSIETDLTDVYEGFIDALGTRADLPGHDTALANARARLRMTTLYYYAAAHGYLVLGTGNKVEDFGVGFYTKYGDGGVDVSPIADLTKSDVYAVARELGIGTDILQAPPTDGLWGDNRTDEDQLGASYPELEWAMGYTGGGREERADKGGGEDLSDRERQVLAIYTRLNAANRHKMQPIPVCTIPEDIR